MPLWATSVATRATRSACVVACSRYSDAPMAAITSTIAISTASAGTLSLEPCGETSPITSRE